MPLHPFHGAIGRLINSKDFPSSIGLNIFKDRACSKDGHRISLYKRAAGTHVRYADVDILIATDKGARVIVEIEESNVKPVHIFGKFFASAFSDCYLVKDRKTAPYSPIAKPTLFVQVLDSSKLEKESNKIDQWRRIDESIQNVLINMPQLKWEYRLFMGTYPGRNMKTQDGEELVQTILAFLI